MKERHYLTPLFEPRSVGIIGASDREGSIGSIVFRNMLDAGFKGRLFAINPNREKVFDQPCYKSVDDVPHRLDLAVIATPAATVSLFTDKTSRLFWGGGVLGAFGALGGVLRDDSRDRRAGPGRPASRRRGSRLRFPCPCRPGPRRPHPIVICPSEAPSSRRPRRCVTNA